MDDNQNDQDEMIEPITDIWAGDGKVCLVIRNASVVEYEGALVPGLSFTPTQAIDVALELLQRTRELMEPE